jgi:hypothetical protein
MSIIANRVAALERRIGPTDKLTREIEAAGRRLIDFVNNIDLDRDREAFEALRAQLQKVLSERGRLR